MRRLARGPAAPREASFHPWPTAQATEMREDDILGRCAAGPLGWVAGLQAGTGLRDEAPRGSSCRGLTLRRGDPRPMIQ